MAIKAPKISDIDEIELKNLMRYLFVLVGLRGQNIPANEEKEFLHMFIRKFYGTHTVEEVRLAFDMAITGKLDVDPKTYENFSTEYFARIMNAYRKWSAQEIRRMETKEVVQMTPQQRKKIDDEHVDYLCRRAWEKLQSMDKGPSYIKNLQKWKREQ